MKLRPCLRLKALFKNLERNVMIPVNVRKDQAMPARYRLDVLTGIGYKSAFYFSCKHSRPLNLSESSYAFCLFTKESCRKQTQDCCQSNLRMKMGEDWDCQYILDIVKLPPSLKAPTFGSMLWDIHVPSPFSSFVIMGRNFVVLFSREAALQLKWQYWLRFMVVIGYN